MGKDNIKASPCSVPADGTPASETMVSVQPMAGAAVERHPLQPFIPEGARVLMLGSFPPSRKRWCMDFFYPNFINDMWRIFGLLFLGDKDRLVDIQAKCFRLDDIRRLLTARGIALYDTACAVRRLKNTASDKDLEIVEQTDIDRLLARMPQCEALVTTGQKAAEVIARRYGVKPPKVGGSVHINIGGGREVEFYRMPSSSRAYPMRVEQKALMYSHVTQFGL